VSVVYCRATACCINLGIRQPAILYELASDSVVEALLHRMACASETGAEMHRAALLLALMSEKKSLQSRIIAFGKTAMLLKQSAGLGSQLVEHPAALAGTNTVLLGLEEIEEGRSEAAAESPVEFGLPHAEAPLEGGGAADGTK
jgi:hypothetical protein